tara:strand:+ start:7880 stop:8611 length:732 start_codon:yes stop_codon:yes gene_type:complete
MSSKVIEQLKEDKNYYGELGGKYLSNSDIIDLLNYKFREKKKTLDMLYGRYFHTLLLEPEKLDTYHVLDSSTRTTKTFKEYTAENNLDSYDVLLEKEIPMIQSWADRMLAHDRMKYDIQDFEAKTEVPAIKELFGVKFKGKADIVNDEFVIDLKTSSNIKAWNRSADTYNYDSQAYIYQQLFEKPVMFYIVDKKTLQLKIATATEDTLLRGRDKVMQAIQIYQEYFAKESTGDVNQVVEVVEF